MTPNKHARAFVERHGIRVLDTNKRAAKFNKLNIDLFKYKDDYNIMDSLSMTYDTEPLYTVEISESELERIGSFEDQVFNNMSEKGHYALFETLMEQKEQEKYLKEKYPAVKKAYEQYSLMLNLAKSGEL